MQVLLPGGVPGFSRVPRRVSGYTGTSNRGSICICFV